MRRMELPQMLAVLLVLLGLVSFSGQTSYVLNGESTVSAASSYKFPSKGKPYAGTTLNVAMVAEPKPIMLKSLVPEFEAMTGIRVNFQELPYATLQEKQLTAVTQGAGAYDIVHVDCVWMGQYAGEGWIVPVDNFVRETDPTVLDLQDFVPRLLEEISTWEGKLYGLPFDTSVMMLYYRTDLFRKYNLKVPQTWDEMYEMAKLITEREKQSGIYGLTLMAKRGVQLGCTYGALLGSYGGYYYDRSYKATLDTSSAIESLDMLNKLVSVSNPGSLAQDYDEATATFSNGKAAMLIQWNDAIPVFNDPSQSKIVGKWAAAALPGVRLADGTIRRAPVIGGWNTGILADSKNKEAAWEFLLWATSKAMEARLAVAQPPARRSVLADPSMARKYPEFSPMLESLDIAWGRPRIGIWPQMTDVIEAALSQSVTGEASPKDALVGAQMLVDQILRSGGYQK